MSQHLRRSRPRQNRIEESGVRLGSTYTARDSPHSVDDGTGSPTGGIFLMVPRLPPSEGCENTIDGRGVGGGEVIAKQGSGPESWIPVTGDAREMLADEHRPDTEVFDSDGMVNNSNNWGRSYGDSSKGNGSRISGGSHGDRECQKHSSAKLDSSGGPVHPHQQQHTHPYRQPRGSSSCSGTPSHAPSERLTLDCIDSPVPSGTVGSNRSSAPSPRLGFSPRSSIGGSAARLKAVCLGSPSASSPESVSPGTRGGGNDCGGLSPKKQGRRPLDSQALARKSADGHGGASQNFKVLGVFPGGSLAWLWLLARGCGGDGGTGNGERGTALSCILLMRIWPC